MRAAANAIFVLALLAWVGGCALILFATIKYTLGLRIHNSIEEVRSSVRLAYRFRFQPAELPLTHGIERILRPGDDVVRISLPINLRVNKPTCLGRDQLPDGHGHEILSFRWLLRPDEMIRPL